MSDSTGLQRQLEALFLEELQDALRVLDGGLTRLEQWDRDPMLVTELFRAAHSLKGAAHASGVTDAVPPCHRLEDAFAALRDGALALDRATLDRLADDVGVLTRLEAARRAHDVGGVESSAPAAEPAGEARARVAVGRLDRLLERSAAVVVTTDRLAALTDELQVIAAASARGAGGLGSPAIGPLVHRARDLERQLRTVTGELAGTAQELRLQPFEEVVAGLAQSVREVSRSTGTDARLVVEGGDVELDREIGDALREPLLHLVRNAAGHGIEPPSERTSRGKPAAGTVTVRAEGHGTDVRICVIDDGAGVDVRRLRELAGAGESAGDDDLELAFLPGVSTASRVTDVSGRGVGLDAARARVESLGGTFQLRSEPGRGTEVELRVPRTLAVLRAMVVDVGDDELVCLPLTSISRLHRIGPEELAHVEGRLEAEVGGHRRPAALLAEALSLPAEAPAHLAIEVRGDDGVLLAHRAVTELEVVLRPLPRRTGAVPGVLGAAVLGDGRLALVANPSSALRAGLSVLARAPMATTQVRRPRVLLAEDTATTRALERSILQRGGYEVLVAVDGADALEQLRAATVDVVVSDVDMPRLDGIELCRALRASVRHREVPVVLVTSLASDHDRQRGLEAGADAYIVKSAFDQAALLDAVGRFV